MRKNLAVVALVFVGTPLLAGEHLVSAQQARDRLVASAAQREADLGAVQGVLGTPDASQAAARLGVDLQHVRAAAATLSEAELADLAQRARLASGDHAAGLDADVRQLLIIFLIVAIVILVLQAVD